MNKLYQPSKRQIQTSNLFKFQKLIEIKYKKKFTSYEKLWKWTNKHPDQFWNLIVEFFDISIKKNKILKTYKPSHQFWTAKFFDKCKINYFMLSVTPNYHSTLVRLNFPFLCGLQCPQ